MNIVSGRTAKMLLDILEDIVGSGEDYTEGYRDGFKKAVEVLEDIK